MRTTNPAPDDGPSDVDLFEQFMSERDPAPIADEAPLASFPPSVQRHLDEAAKAHRQALAQTSGLVPAAAAELARSSPEMFGFATVLQTGGTGIAFDTQLVETVTVTDELRIMGVRVAASVRTETKTFAERRAIRREG